MKAGEDAGEYEVVRAVAIIATRAARSTWTSTVTAASPAARFSAVLPGWCRACAAAAGRERDRRRDRRRIGALKKRHEEKKLGVDADEYLPPGSSAVVAVVNNQYADKVEAALVNSDKRIQQGDRLGRQRGVAEGDRKVAGRGVGRDHLVDRGRRAGTDAGPPRWPKKEWR